jgi:hypothetical protein
MSEATDGFEFAGQSLPNRFDSWQHFRDITAMLEENSTVDEVPVVKPKTNVGFRERWFRENDSGKVVRIVEPDAPFPGIIELVE